MPFLDITIGVVFGRDGVGLIDCGSTLVEGRAIDADIRAVDDRGVTDLVFAHHLEVTVHKPSMRADACTTAPAPANSTRPPRSRESKKGRTRTAGTPPRSTSARLARDGRGRRCAGAP